MIIDTLLHYFAGTREATLQDVLAELQPLGYATVNPMTGEFQLDSSRAFKVELVTQQAEWDTTDPLHPVLIKPRVTIPGVAIWVCSGAVDNALWSLPGNVARLQADRTKHDAGDPTWLIRTRLDAATMASVQIEPVIAGTTYPFG